LRVQVTARWAGSATLLAGLCVSCIPRIAAAQASEAPVAGTLLRSFTDSGHVNVRSLVEEWSLLLPGDGRLGLHWNNERVTIPGIAATPGSREAVDAVTTASRPIAGNPYQEYVKTRNELQGDYARGHAAANYYISSEADYLAQQLGANVNRDFGDQQLNLSIGTSYGWDEISPLANAAAQAPANTKRTLHVNAVATEVLSPTTLLRWGLEYNIVSGLQHNPYRNVFAGGSYAPERHPDHRERRDTFVRLNQYLPDRASLKLNYRLYNDDWGITSHEVGTSLSQYVTHGLAATYEYRYYTQTNASFYRSEYLTAGGIDGYRSGDYRMNDLASHLFGASLRMDMEALAVNHRLLGRTALWLNYQRYFNSNNYSANILETGLDLRFR
jgi:hypothetical protein